MNSRSLGEVSQGNLSRARQKKQLKIEAHHQAIVLILMAPSLPSASLFTAEKRMSLRPSTARTFVTLVVLQSSFLLTGLFWLLLDTTKSSVCGPLAEKEKLEGDAIPSSPQSKWRLDTNLPCLLWPLLLTIVASSPVVLTEKS